MSRMTSVHSGDSGEERLQVWSYTPQVLMGRSHSTAEHRDRPWASVKTARRTNRKEQKLY